MLMNAMTGHMGAIKCASTLMDLTHVHAGVATGLIQMGTVAQVNSEQIIINASKDLLHGSHLDIDECSEESDRCHQICHNAIGTYACSCINGYKLSQDGTNCHGTLPNVS